MTDEYIDKTEFDNLIDFLVYCHDNYNMETKTFPNIDLGYCNNLISSDGTKSILLKKIKKGLIGNSNVTLNILDTKNVYNIFTLMELCGITDNIKVLFFKVKCNGTLVKDWKNKAVFGCKYFLKYIKDLPETHNVEINIIKTDINKILKEHKNFFSLQEELNYRTPVKGIVSLHPDYLKMNKTPLLNNIIKNVKKTMKKTIKNVKKTMKNVKKTLRIGGTKMRQHKN